MRLAIFNVSKTLNLEIYVADWLQSGLDRSSLFIATLIHAHSALTAITIRIPPKLSAKISNAHAFLVVSSVEKKVPLTLVSFSGSQSRAQQHCPRFRPREVAAKMAANSRNPQ